ncbi:MAG: energy-coupling factor transporter transmembrane protein EcfT [Deltaproteobacteria bacterium]|nr:energy-coupling factor transporter transmembrane protein EcfT [Deltaproteobacteria bacterium]
MRILQDITLGQYFPGNSFLHRLDPRSKLISLILLMVTIFTTDSLFPLVMTACLLLLLGKLASFSIPFLLRGVGLFFWLFVFTSLFHLFFTPGDSIYPFPLFGLDVTSQGLSRGAVVFTQLFMVIFTANIFTLTTEPMDLARGLEKIFKPLKKIGVKTEEISLMISLVIRFIPILKRESLKIYYAQRGRGMDFARLPLMKRGKNLIAIIGPLFTNIFSRSDTIVLAMVSRGFGRGEKVGMLRELSFKGRDLGSVAAVILFSFIMALKY